MPAIAKVEPLTPARALRGPFDYLLPAALADVEVGSLLVVPFGRRRVLGVVVDLASESAVAPERLAAPVHALEQGVPAELVRLAHWIADEYCSTPARALSLVLPPGAGQRPRVRARTALAAEISAAGAAALEDGERLGTRQRAALEALRAAAAPLATAGLPGGHATARRLAERGFVALERRARPRRPHHAAVGSPAPAGAALPTPAQSAALAPVEAAIAAGRAERLLLHGVTGSGKTEVYVRAAAAALERGRSAIVLVPEIALTPQIVARFIARFGETVAVLHSRLSDGERYDEWRRLRAGAARVCVGPRSAVFAPLADLGLVVVDEEHDPSYKHEGDPRYDARRVAERRAAAAGAVLLAGSATPRPESWRSLRRLRLPERVDGRPLPPVEVLDMRDAAHALHPRTRGGARGGPARAAQGDRAAQPPRLVQLPLLPLVRARVGVPALRRRPGAPSGRGRGHLPPLRPPRAGRRSAATRAARCRSPVTARAPSVSSTSWPRRSRPTRRSRCSASTPTRRRAAAPSPGCSSVSTARPPACWSARRWSPRATTSPTSRSGWCSTPTRRCASRTSAPRSARSRSSPSWPGVPAVGPAAGA